MSKPLEGIKVVEIAQEIQGPFASLFLADMGADVVKIENKETGDLSRWMLTSLIGGPEVKVLDDDWTAVTTDGTKSAHFEHTVAVTSNGPWVLTRPREMQGPSW